MAEVSPCRRTPSTMPSSVHSMEWSLQDFGTCRVGKAQRAHHRSTNRVAWDGGHGAKTAFAHPTHAHALNHPTASPVKEKYNPAAVSAQEITSIPLSNCTPLSPITCTSEITDSTRAAASAKRGQFLRRWAASQTK